ncbi:MAG: SLC13 family permease [Deltaproteobacteria bacterium]|nr:SLC13 family permease [Deltaproteobacteria bacterium]
MAMTSVKQLMFTMWFVVMALFGVWPSAAMGANAHSSAPDKNSSRAPRYISIDLKSPLKSLIAGENGSFEVEAALQQPKSAEKHPLTWDREAASPVTVWVSSPPNSGITFIDHARPGRPVHHLLVRFPPVDTVTSQPLSVKIAYALAPDAKTGHHAFWLDVAGEMTTRKGEKINDMGIVRLPFEVDTHLKTKLLMLLVVAVAVFLFIVEWVRVDVVGILMMVVLPELGLLNAHDAFRGLSSNAVIAIIGVMIISYGLNRTGLVNRMLQPVLPLIQKSASRLVTIFSGLIAAISSVMQNTGAAVLFLPAIRLTATHKLKVPISRVLMPIGMAAILGGTLTMIGTSPLILLNDILPQGMPKFGFLELTPIGMALVIGGVLFLSTGGMAILSASYRNGSGGEKETTETSHDAVRDAYPLINGPYEVFVPEDSRAEKESPEMFAIRHQYLVNIVASVKDDGTCQVAPLPQTTIRGGLSLCIYGPAKGVEDFVRDYGLILQKEPVQFRNTLFNPSIAGIVEVVVSPRSSLLGKTIKEIRFRETFGVNPLAVHQSGETYYRELADLPLQAGDIVLIHGTWEQFHALQEHHQNFIIVSPFEEEFQKPEKGKRALICFLITLFLMLFSSFYFQKQLYNPLPLSVCLMLGALGMILTKVMTIAEAYRAVDWRTIFLLGGLIPLGMAVTQTGTAQWIAKGIIIGLGDFMSPLLLLIILAVVSCAFTLVISNVGACALLVPLGVSMAHQIGMDARVAVIVVGLGVSNSFILPTHQVNALYMGPGGYRTRDYIKIGGVLSLIYIAILVAMTDILYL